MVHTRLSTLVVVSLLILVAPCGCASKYHKTQVLAHHFVGEEMRHGVVTTVHDKIAIESIDGASTQNVTYRFWVVTHAADAYRLTPGKHVITCSYHTGFLSTVHNLSLEITVEAGYRYVLGVHPAPEMEQNWRLVLDRVEPLPGS